MGSSPIGSSIKNKDRIRLISYSIFLEYLCQWRLSCINDGYNGTYYRYVFSYPMTFPNTITCSLAIIRNQAATNDIVYTITEGYSDSNYNFNLVSCFSLARISNNGNVSMNIGSQAIINLFVLGF